MPLSNLYFKIVFEFIKWQVKKIIEGHFHLPLFLIISLSVFILFLFEIHLKIVCLF